MELNFKKLLKEVDSSNPQKIFELGLCYFYGIDVKQDKSKGLKWFELAADLGLPVAQRQVGICYLDGEGVKENEREAVKWLLKASDAGDANAQNKLGVCCYRGRGCKRSSKNSVKWHLKSACGGNVYAMVNLAHSYYEGEGIEQDYAKAYALFEQAARLGDQRARRDLCVCLIEGHGVAQDLEAATKMAIEFDLVGDIGEIKDPEENTIAWIENLAKSGNTAAQSAMGRHYLNGEWGLKKNKAKARQWLVLAALNESGEAKFYLERIANGRKKK